MTTCPPWTTTRCAGDAPTVHIAFDEATAILAGDALQTLAFEILSDPRNAEDAGVRAELVLLLARAAGWHGMAEGQALDLAAGERDMDLRAVATMQALKTGALFRFACEAGAVLGGAPAKDRAALVAYGTAFGQAFQLADDLLDTEGDAEEAWQGRRQGRQARARPRSSPCSAPKPPERASPRWSTKPGTRLRPFGERAAPLKQAARFVAERRA